MAGEALVELSELSAPAVTRKALQTLVSCPLSVLPAVLPLSRYTS